MKTRILALSVLGATLVVAVAASLQPLKVKTGLWQMTQTIQWTGLPPQFQAAMAQGSTHGYQSCVKPENLSSNPFASSHDKCTWTVVTSTGTDMEVRGTSCEMGSELGMTSAEIHGVIHVVDPENGTGSFDMIMTRNGQKITGHATYTGKWVGSSCPSE